MNSYDDNILTEKHEDKSERSEQQWTVIDSTNIESIDKFWTSINILNKNLHTVLPRVCGLVITSCNKLLLPIHETTLNVGSILSLPLSENECVSDVLQKFKDCGIKLETVEDIEICNLECSYIIVQKLILKIPTDSSNFWILTLIDCANAEAIFLLLQNSAVTNTSEKFKFQSVFPFKFSYKDDNIRLMKFTSTGEFDSCWLKNTLFPKVLKWAYASPQKPAVKSLSLIAIDEYVNLYHSLKEKYGSHMVKIWPERTDPQKFVYEDISIATYLLLLWRKQRLEAGRPDWLQSFVDLGCGNGLLVYILSSEGHMGKGLDVRKRAIWDYYPQSTQLQVDTIIPSDNFLFPNTDWIIGNHSDELTPWIPVIAARSSHKCCFFLLPCCFYDFSGSKYQRQNTELSQYADYLEYLKYVCAVCGFETKIDRLKIPSTKRICLIGSKRTYVEAESDRIQTDIKCLIKSKNKEGETVIQKGDTDWVTGFKAREPVEKVRNCTQIDSGLRDQIVTLITHQLLAKHNPLNVIADGGREKIWNAGDIMNISEIASFIPANLLQQLKNECGGLQTLLKNYHYIFFVSEGKVQFRTPHNMHCKTMKSKHRKRKRESRVLKHKIKPCWFHNNHPDGCPLPDEICTFRH